MQATGMKRFPAGRLNDEPSIGLSASLRAAGFQLGRLQTGTPARLDKNTIDFSNMTQQDGDVVPSPFSYMHRTVDNAVSRYSAFGKIEKTHLVMQDKCYVLLFALSPAWLNISISILFCPMAELRTSQLSRIDVVVLDTIRWPYHFDIFQARNCAHHRLLHFLGNTAR